MGTTQPITGIIATVFVIAFSLLFISLFSFPTFATWVSYYLICTIPMQIVVAVNWECRLPNAAARQDQPMRGVLLTLVTVFAGIIVSVFYLSYVGGNIKPPTPMLAQCTIVSVVVTFWLSIMWGGWPFRAIIKNRMIAGIVQWIACYVLNYVLFRIFFNYDFMKDAPVYAPALDPHGMFNAWNALVFYVTALSFMFLMLHMELWPLSKSRALMKQPVLGLVWTALALLLAAAALHLGTRLLGMDVVRFLVSVPIPFIFGTIVVLNMLEGSLFKSSRQPIKGIFSVCAAALIGTALAWFYQALAGVVTGRLHSGPPAYDFEIWLASALLAVTFPFMIICAAFFNFWPFRSDRLAENAK